MGPGVLVCVLASLACSDALGPAEEEAQDQIVFVSTRFGEVSESGRPWDDLYRMNADGTDVVRLTEVSDRYRALRLSPDGSTLAFYSQVSGCYDIWVMNVDGTGLTQLTGVDAYERCNSHPWWSRDGSKIAFLTSRNVREGRGWDVYVMDADGANPVDASANPSTDPATYNDLPRGWSPDGRVVISSSRDGQGRTYLAAVDGSGVVPLFGDGLYEDPRWSPDGSRVVAVLYDDYIGEVYALAAGGTGALNLSDHPADDWLQVGTDPWSPDGGRVAIGSRRTGDVDIWVGDVDALTLTNVSAHPAEDIFIAWTPDGRILLQSDRTGDEGLYVVNADGTELVNLTNAPSSDEGPDAVWVTRR